MTLNKEERLLVAERARALVSPSIIAAYQAQGAVVLRNVLNAQEIDLLRAGLDRNLINLSPRAINATQPNDKGKFVEDFCNWQRIPEYQTIALSSALPWVASLLMQSQTVRFYHDHMLTKYPGTRTPTPWHQDQPYYNISGHQSASFWIPVDPVSRDSTLEFLSGSHLGPWLMPRTFMDQQAKWFPEGSLQDLPNIDKQRDSLPILGWALEPGDVLCFHMLTLHASSGVGPQQMRRVFSARYLGDDIRHAPRPWVTSPDFPGLAEQLPAGAPMDHELFPLVIDCWPATDSNRVT